MAGHSKWANIKHRKAAADAKLAAKKAEADAAKAAEAAKLADAAAKEGFPVLDLGEVSAPVRPIPRAPR